MLRHYMVGRYFIFTQVQKTPINCNFAMPIKFTSTTMVKKYVLSSSNSIVFTVFMKQNFEFIAFQIGAVIIRDTFLQLLLIMMLKWKSLVKEENIPH